MSHSLLPTHFMWKEYIRLNPDLAHIKNRLDAEIHWINTGRSQMRLYHKDQLNVRCEFGAEVVLYGCYYYYLYTKNLLFDNKITTYKGMKDIYYFVKPENIIEKDEQRQCAKPIHCRLLVNNSEGVENFNMNYFKPIPFKSQFQNSIFQFEKPLLIVHNKYNIEWSDKPINFFDVTTLDAIFSKLHKDYHIVYIRPSNKKINLKWKQFSIDHNLIKEDLNDFELIESNYKNSVHVFDDILEQHPNYSYNLCKLMLHANCNNFINVQGGNTMFTAFFIGKMLILHKKGHEIKSKCYNGWYKELNSNEKEIRVCETDSSLIKNLDMFL